MRVLVRNGQRNLESNFQRRTWSTRKDSCEQNIFIDFASFWQRFWFLIVIFEWHWKTESFFDLPFTQWLVSLIISTYFYLQKLKAWTLEDEYSLINGIKQYGVGEWELIRRDYLSEWVFLQSLLSNGFLGCGRNSIESLPITWHSRHWQLYWLDRRFGGDQKGIPYPFPLIP